MAKQVQINEQKKDLRNGDLWAWWPPWVIGLNTQSVWRGRRQCHSIPLLLLDRGLLEREHAQRKSRIEAWRVTEATEGCWTLHTHSPGSASRLADNTSTLSPCGGPWGTQGCSNYSLLSGFALRCSTKSGPKVASSFSPTEFTHEGGKAVSWLTTLISDRCRRRKSKGTSPLKVEELIFSECQTRGTNVATWRLGDGDLPDDLIYFL